MDGWMDGWMDCVVWCERTNERTVSVSVSVSGRYEAHLLEQLQFKYDRLNGTFQGLVNDRSDWGASPVRSVLHVCVLACSACVCVCVCVCVRVCVWIHVFVFVTLRACAGIARSFFDWPCVCFIVYACTHCVTVCCSRGLRPVVG